MKIIPKSQQAAPLSDAFFDIPPHAPDGIELARKQLEGRSFPREELYRRLKAYNDSIGNHALNLEQILDPQKYCVVTGQQLGLMGGPAYMILKGISCLQLAREANAIPIFWLATEDHDIPEINHTYLVDALGNLREYRLSLPKNHQVEDLELNEEHWDTIHAFLKEVKWTETLKPGGSYTQAMASFLVQIFAGTGMVFLEPKILRPLAKDFFKSEIKNSAQIARLLRETTTALEKEGIEPLLTLGETHLFFKNTHHIRQKVKREGDVFTIGHDTYSEKELLDLIDHQSECFSVNVAARPVLQSLLLPTLAYVAGPNEMQYYQQLRAYHHFYGVKMPWIVRRLSATFISLEAAQVLEKLKLAPWDPIPHSWNHFFANEQEARQKTQEMGIPYSALHTLRNQLHPHEGLQERTLNWGYWQAQTEHNLIQALLQNCDWRMNQQHLYCYL